MPQPGRTRLSLCITEECLTNGAYCDRRTYFSLQKSPLKILSLAIILTTLLWAPALPASDDAYVSFAKSLPADRYDKSLPVVPLERWLTLILPPHVVAVWGETVTDCGEQTGVPEIDRKRDMPLCVEIELKEKGKSLGYLLVFVGTHKKGLLKESVALYYGYIRQGEKTVVLKNLKEITKLTGR
jgi:hypothetical protein